MEEVEIYVRLLDEGVSVWRPLPALEAGEGYRLLAASDLDQETEELEFAPGTLVRVETKTLEGARVQVAVSEFVSE